jgi:hypothetical protein
VAVKVTLSPTVGELVEVLDSPSKVVVAVVLTDVLLPPELQPVVSSALNASKIRTIPLHMRLSFIVNASRSCWEKKKLIWREFCRGQRAIY